MDIFFLAQTREENGILEQFKLLLLCTPYLVDFLAGIITLQLFISIIKSGQNNSRGISVIEKPLQEQILPVLEKFASNHDTQSYFYYILR